DGSFVMLALWVASRRQPAFSSGVVVSHLLLPAVLRICPGAVAGRLMSRRSTPLRHMALLVFLLAALMGGGGLLAQPLPPELQKALAATRLPESAVSIVVKELDGPVLMALNPSQPRNPASVMKLVTTWGGLSILGPEYTW